MFKQINFSDLLRQCLISLPFFDPSANRYLINFAAKVLGLINITLYTISIKLLFSFLFSVARKPQVKTIRFGPYRKPMDYIEDLEEGFVTSPKELFDGLLNFYKQYSSAPWENFHQNTFSFEQHKRSSNCDLNESFSTEHWKAQSKNSRPTYRSFLTTEPRVVGRTAFLEAEPDILTSTGGLPLMSNCPIFCPDPQSSLPIAGKISQVKLQPNFFSSSDGSPSSNSSISSPDSQSPHVMAVQISKSKAQPKSVSSLDGSPASNCTVLSRDSQRISVRAP